MVSESGEIVLLWCVAALLGLIVVRKEWRRVAPWRKEMKRHAVLKSIEVAASELQSNVLSSSNESAQVGPGSSTRLHKRCEVCFCPPKSRCSRCKAAYYCSGKCRKIHWREGHREECY